MFEPGGLSTLVGDVSVGVPVESVDVLLEFVDVPAPGGPVDVAGDPVVSGLPAPEPVVVELPFAFPELPFPPFPLPEFPFPAASFGAVAEPAIVTPDGLSVDWLDAGVPVSVVVAVVEVVSLIVGITWPAVATGVDPSG